MVTRKILREIGEFGLIDRIRKWTSSSDPFLVKGIGDDVAVVKLGEKVLLLTTDILIEDIHFRRSWTNPFDLGRKALAVSLSDIASMGGTPKYFLISIGLPKNLPLSFISSLYRGLRKEAEQFQTELIGGDTSLSQRIVINICLLGEGKEENVLFRKGARVGDALFVTGTLGDAALGLKILQKGRKIQGSKRLIQKLLSPRPRIELGQALAKKHWATAMIDVSDGLLIDTSHLLKESGVGACIWENRIPLSRSYLKQIHSLSNDPIHLALSGGEDYELLFTAPNEIGRRISFLSRLFKVPITHIGKILPQREGLQIIREDGGIYTPSQLGFEHFK